MTKQHFLQILAEALGTDEKLSADTKRSEVKLWDSMGQVSILSMLQEHFEVTLQMEELVALNSVQDIINILQERNVVLD
jgi:acyl carrier protein